MKLIEALENALELIEKEGYESGDIHDDFALAIERLRNKFPQSIREEL